MPRKPITHEQRAAKVQAAARALPKALKAAQADPDNVALWEAVEELGATVHRQARLLAGKSKGG